MKTVTRHHIDASVIQSYIADTSSSLEKTLKAARKNPKHLFQLILIAQEYAGYLSIVEAESPELCRALRIIGQTAGAIFATSSVSEGSVEVLLDDLPAYLPATGPTGYSIPNNWLDGFFAAIICNDIQTLDILLKTPIDVLRRSRTKSEECLYLLVDTFQAFYTAAKDIGERLSAALSATDTERLSIDPDYTILVVVPQMKLMYRLIAKDVQSFNQVLFKTLESHKKYWSSSDRRSRPDGFLALGALAFATLAHSIGMPIEVESDYIPIRLIRGDCRQ